MRIRIALFVGILLLVATAAFCQIPAKAAEPKVEQPERIALDREIELTVQLAVLELENLELKIQALTAQRNAQKDKLDALAKTLEKPGYLIQKGPDGRWGYVRKPKE